MKLKHVDLVVGSIYQDAREVRTKFSKTFTNYFFPVGNEVKAVVEDWVKFLRDVKLWGNDNPLFPSTLMKCGTTRQFEAAGLKRALWSNSSPIGKILSDAFERVGLPYFNPYSFRHMLVRHEQQVCKTSEDF